MQIKNIKKDFPILNKKKLIYLDNTATTQKPKQVIEKITKYYETENANAHRGAYKLSYESGKKYEEARETIKKFLNAKHKEEIIFTKNTTNSINLLSKTIGNELKKGDRILITIMEHHSNLIPWQQLKKNGIKLEYVGITKEGKLNQEELKEQLNKKPKIVSFTAASNVLGTINHIKEITKQAKEINSTVIIDGAQYLPHKKIDVQKIKPDFLAFSGHKMLGPTGIGVLYGQKKILEEMEPYETGGDMINKVTKDKSEWAEIPRKFEAGTANIAGAIGMAEAVKYLEKIGFEKIKKHEEKLTKETIEEMKKIEGIDIYGIENEKERLGIISFNVKGVHPHDVATILDQKNIAIRSGSHCAEPLMQEMKINGSARASYYVYNEEEDVKKLIEGIKQVKKIFKK